MRRRRELLGRVRLRTCPSSRAAGASGASVAGNSAAGPAINASIIDMGNRFRLIVNEVQAVTPIHPLPKLPVARVLWKPYPDMNTGCTAWILAGGAHHTCYSQNLTSEHMRDFADMAGIEFALIGKNTDLYQFRNELRWNEVYYR